MSFFRPARPSDLPIGLGAERAAYDGLGRPRWLAGRKARYFSEQRAALSEGLWIWEGEGEPDSVPEDHASHQSQSGPRRLEALHDKLRSLLSHEDGPLPDNFADVIWRGAAEIQSVAAQSPRRAMAWLVMASRPSNALLNAIHVAFLCELMGAKLSWSANERQETLCAALTMNWTILELQDELNSKGRAPSPSERLAIMSHPANVERLLLDYGVQSPIWLSCCKQHHEDPTGRGYPDKLVGAELERHGGLLRCADRYVVMTATRARRVGMAPLEALAHLREQERSFESSAVDALTLSLGRLPPGSPALTPEGVVAWPVDEDAHGRAQIILADGSETKIPLCDLTAQNPPLATPSFAALSTLLDIL